MCGICGFNWGDRDLITRMSSKLEHRGPDSSGYFTDSSLSLGFRRLSIIDLSKKGNQPMYNEEGTLCVVFNGEIYNFKELRKELEDKGHTFFSDADTEVIVHGYEEYGMDLFSKLNGMFGLALYDMPARTLILARDRLGIKPLYYYWDYRDKFIFSSEIKSIFLDTEVKKAINSQSLTNFLGYKYVPGPESIFQNIYKLQPGHYLQFDLKKRSLDIKQYWDICFKETSVDEMTALRKADSLLNDSVKRRMISDVPVGVFLSGGLDSSLITALMSKHSPDHVKTFSVGFEQSKGTFVEHHNELSYAKDVSDSFSTIHHELIMNFDDIVKNLPLVTYHMDEPMSDLASIPTYMISKFAKKKVTVTLAGDGADEFFVGYRQSILHRYSSFLKWFPWVVTKMLPETHKLRRAGDILSISSPSSRAAAWGSVFSGKQRSEILSKSVRSQVDSSNNVIISDYKNQMHTLTPLNQNLYIEAKTWLPDDLLMKIDKTSMMASLEARVPYLDHRLVELVSSFSTGLRIKGLTTKYLQKKMAQNYLPRRIIYRKKHGFTLPMTEWFRHDLRTYAEEMLDDKELYSFINKRYVDKIFSLHKSAKEDYGFHLNALLSFSIWYKLYMQEQPVSKL